MQNDLSDTTGFDRRALVRLQWAFRAAIAALALVECWIARFSLNFDGVFYLDMGDQYWKGNWHAALNPYWSPLYSWLTGLMFRLTKPSMRWEFPEVHLLNFTILVAALFCFEFFWRELLAMSDEGTRAVASGQYSWALGYLLFTYLYLESFYTNHGDTLVGIVTPDLIVAAIMFLIFGMILQFTAGRKGIAFAGLMGFVFGIGYLAKTAMFPFGFAVLATMLGVAWKRRSGIWLTAIALICFLATSAPFIAAISWNNHRFTFGDSGKMNIAWHVNGTKPMYFHWQGDAKSRALHPTRRILRWPEVYEFAFPVSGTYPVFYDPTYWWAGVDTRMSLAGEIACLKTNAMTIGFYFVGPAGILTAIVLLMFFQADGITDFWKQLIRFIPILVPSAVVFLMYAMLIWEPRYTSAAMLAVLGALIASTRISDQTRRTMVLRSASFTLALMVVILSLQTIHKARTESPFWMKTVEATEEMRAMGIQAGESVALIGDAFPSDGLTNLDLARLDHVRIIAEVPHSWERGDSATAFWNQDSAGQQIVLAALKNAGAKVVIANLLPLKLPPGWAPVGGTGYAVFFFR